MTHDSTAPSDTFDLDDPAPPPRRGGALLVAWLLVVTILAGIAIWLVVNAPATRARLADQAPRFIAMLPADPNAPPPVPVPVPPIPAPPPVTVAQLPPPPPVPAPVPKAETKAAPAPAPIPPPAPPPAPAPAPAQSKPPAPIPPKAERKPPAPAPASVAPAPVSVAPTPAPAPASVAPTPAPVVPAPVVPAAVDGGLLERGPHGMLPIIGPMDGRLPWQVYARPFSPPPPIPADGDKPARDVPRIAVLVSGLGLSASATDLAIQRLPGEVSLAFSPLSANLPSRLAAARQAGHEVFLDLALEPVNYPADDPGPYTLLTQLPERDLLDRLHWQLAQGAGYVGVLAGPGGERFTGSIAANAALLPALRKRGLLYVDSRANPRSVAPRMARDYGLARVMADRIADRDPTRIEIDGELLGVELIATRNGQAVVMLGAAPGGLERLEFWLATLPRKGFVLAPVSAIANRQPDPTPPTEP